MKKKLSKKLCAEFKNLKDVFRMRGNVDLAYVFGSSVKGYKNYTPSDVDIAVLIKQRINSEKRMDVQIGVATQAEKLFGRRADVVVLNDASPFLRFQVLKYGEFIYEREHGMDSRFRFDVMTKYFDAVVLQNFFYLRMRRRGCG